MANEKEKRTASERIEDCERAIMSGFQVTNNLARDVMVIKDALKLLNNKVTSIAQASVAGEKLTEEVLAKYMIENNVNDLRGKVENLVNQGVLVPADTAGDNTFLVGSENEASGKVVHPRIQFTFGSLEKDLQEKLKGAKVGDIVTFQDDKLRFVVKEIYNIVPPKPEPVDTPTADTPAASTDTPAASTDTPAANPAAANTTTPAASPTAAPAAQSSNGTPAADQPGQGSGN